MNGAACSPIGFDALPTSDVRPIKTRRAPPLRSPRPHRGAGVEPSGIGASTTGAGDHSHEPSFTVEPGFSSGPRARPASRRGAVNGAPRLPTSWPTSSSSDCTASARATSCRSATEHGSPHHTTAQELIDGTPWWCGVEKIKILRQLDVLSAGADFSTADEGSGPPSGFYDPARHGFGMTSACSLRAPSVATIPREQRPPSSLVEPGPNTSEIDRLSSEGTP